MAWSLEISRDSKDSQGNRQTSAKTVVDAVVVKVVKAALQERAIPPLRLRRERPAWMSQ
jgi:hypothetical protein